MCSCGQGFNYFSQFPLASPRKTCQYNQLWLKWKSADLERMSLLEGLLKDEACCGCIVKINGICFEVCGGCDGCDSCSVAAYHIVCLGCMSSSASFMCAEDKG